MWFFGGYFLNIRSIVLKWMLAPLLIGVVGLTSYWAVLKIGEDDPQYALNNLAKTAKITAYDIGFYTGREAGSGYTLGELDGTFLGMLRLFPQAVNVSLFRPYLWEVRNPLMLLSALESLILLITTLYILMKIRFNIFLYLNNPIVLFSLIFSITFSFAVGVSTYNFGTLARYKIPLLPFYALALLLIHYHYQENKERKFLELEETEK